MNMPGDDIDIIVHLVLVVTERRCTYRKLAYREGYLKYPSSCSYRPLQPTATKSRPVCRFLAGALHVVRIKVEAISQLVTDTAVCRIELHLFTGHHQGPGQLRPRNDRCWSPRPCYG